MNCGKIVRFSQDLLFEEKCQKVRVTPYELRAPKCRLHNVLIIYYFIKSVVNDHRSRQVETFIEATYRLL